MTAHSAASLTHPDMRGWLPATASADADLLPELSQIAARSNDLVRNHGVADGALQTITDNVIGVGLRLSSTPDYRLLGKDKAWAEEWSKTVESLWRTHAEAVDIDAGRSLNFHGLTEQVFRHGWTDGEGLALPLWLPRPGSRFATRIQVIDPARLSNPVGRMDGPRLRSGIEVDQYGAPLAYHIRKAHPGDRMLADAADLNAWERIPATTAWGRARVIHVHDKARAGQSRGKPSLTAVMRQFKVLGDFTNAELKAAVVNAKIAVLTESAASQESIVELLSSDPEAREKYTQALSERGLSTISMEDGQIIPLEIGEKLAGFTPSRPSGSFDPFVTSIFRHIATGLNIPYELLMKDFSRTNYSSARAALIEAWRFFRGRRQWIASYWARPVFELWLEEAVNLGLVDAPDFYENRAAYCRCRWIGPGRGWIDPTKEADAARIRMDYNLSTLEAECAEQGLDWEEVLEQRATEKARMEALGLTPPADPLKPKTDYPSDLEDEAKRKEEAAAKKDEPAAAAAPTSITVNTPDVHVTSAPVHVSLTVPPRPAGKLSFVRHEDGRVEMMESEPDEDEE
jgi:lambda family phage portal protein